jgi:gluconate 2-dehydrogenase alpha chain
MSELLHEAGATETWLSYRRLPAAPFQSVFGATRLGDDPAASVVDRWCFAHDVPNLAIVGASTFPTSGGYGPTATIQALAWRMADRLVAQWTSIAGSPRSPRRSEALESTA